MKSLLSLVVNTDALLVFLLFTSVNWLPVLIIGPLSLLGGAPGGRLSRRLRPAVLRALVMVFGLVNPVWLMSAG
ncbi:TSUP family transporter [Actinomadura sp. 6N118]|uniref:TSUP family transporter n=1 Tax=Actinomadura sp. 6N118 TaxID=3375151 RepID=UPI0037A677F4